MVGSASIWWPLMVTCRSGSRVWMIFLMLQPVLAWRSRAIASTVNTIVRWASIASRRQWKIRRAARSLLDIRNDCSTCQRSWYSRHETRSFHASHVNRLLNNPPGTVSPHRALQGRSRDGPRACPSRHRVVVCPVVSRDCRESPWQESSVPRIDEPPRCEGVHDETDGEQREGEDQHCRDDRSGEPQWVGGGRSDSKNLDQEPNDCSADHWTGLAEHVEQGGCRAEVLGAEK